MNHWIRHFNGVQSERPRQHLGPSDVHFGVILLVYSTTAAAVGPSDKYTYFDTHQTQIVSPKLQTKISFHPPIR